LPPKRSKKSKKAGKTRKSPIDQRIVKALTHDLRVQILGIFNERIASPKELSDELGEGLSQVSYHVKVLREYECIELVSTEPRRGAVEHYYRATSRAFLTDRTWFGLPDSVRPGLSADLVESIAGDAATSLKQGIFDERKDRHMSRTPVILDEVGWREMVKALGGTLKQVEKIQKQSSARLRKSGEAGFTASVALMGFEIPDQRKESPKKPKKKAKSKGKRKK
jgi:DNA-binding transcriptional ArsR family regulator